MKVSLNAPYASVPLWQGGLDYAKRHKGKFARDKQVPFLPESQKILCLAADAKIRPLWFEFYVALPFHCFATMVLRALISHNLQQP